MGIDLSPLKEVMDSLFIKVVILLAVPFIVAMVVGFILKLLKVPGKIIGTIVSLVFIILLLKWATNYL